MGKRTFLQHQSRRIQVGKIGWAYLSCTNNQWEHKSCLNHLASYTHCNSQQNKLCLWWKVTILHTLDLSKSLCFKSVFSFEKRKNKKKKKHNQLMFMHKNSGSHCGGMCGWAVNNPKLQIWRSGVQALPVVLLS